jgi:uncharacterized glyoxalase superfamily protein PhnB
MNPRFPAAVPEVPVTDLDDAIAYYLDHLGFHQDWGDDGGIGIVGISRGQCLLYLTSRSFREGYGNAGPVVIWLALSSNTEVDMLHDEWRDRGAKVVSPPESKPWKLHEFTATDLDGNFLRVFHDFRFDT